MKVTKYFFSYKIDEDKNLIVNTLSGAVDVIDDKSNDLLVNGKIPEDEELTEVLKERGYLFENDEQEEASFQKLQKYLKYLKGNFANITTALLCPTYSCNLRCTYCFQDHQLHMHKQVMTENQVDLAFEAIEEKLMPYAGTTKYSIILFGGEPLQVETKSIVEYILEKCRMKNISITIVTNGVNIPIFYNVFEKYRNILSFQVTLDGIAEVHDKRRIFPNGKGSFNIIVDNIDSLVKSGFNTKIRVNLDYENIDSIDKLMNLMEEKEWTKLKNFSIQMSPVSNHGELPSCNAPVEFEIFDKLCEKFPDIKEFTDKYKVSLGPDMFRNTSIFNRVLHEKSIPQSVSPSIAYCESALLKNIAMGPDGFIYPCAQTIGIKEYAIGSFAPQGEIFEDKANCWKERTIFSIKQCSKCDIAPICGGGCPFSALKFNGNPNTPYCGRTREVFDKFINKKKNDFLKKMGE